LYLLPLSILLSFFFGSTSFELLEESTQTKVDSKMESAIAKGEGINVMADACSKGVHSIVSVMASGINMGAICLELKDLNPEDAAENSITGAEQIRDHVVPLIRGLPEGGANVVALVCDTASDEVAGMNLVIAMLPWLTLIYCFW
jgi:hypothetical protein